MNKRIIVMAALALFATPAYAQTSVQGSAPDNTPDVSTAPLKVGCVYDASPDTYTDGDVGNCHLDSDGDLRVSGTVTTSGTSTVSGATAISAAPSENPVYTGCIYSPTLSAIAAGDKVPCVGDIQGAQTVNGYGIATVTSDGIVVGQIGGHRLENGGSVYYLPTQSIQYVYNGTSWDNARSVINGANSTGTGLQAAGQMGQRDDTSPQSCTENQFCNVRITASGMQLNSPASVVPYSAVLGTPAVQIRGASGNVANSAATATLAGTATTTVYISGFTCTPGGATAAALVDLTVTGTLGGTLTYTAGAPAGAAVAGTPVNVNFNPPHPASAVNTNIVVSMPALGTGNTKAACVATGFYM